MMYVILAVVILVIGAWDINPVVDWIDAKNWPMELKSAVMLIVLGIVPALIIGVGIIGDTTWGKKKAG